MDPIGGENYLSLNDLALSDDDVHELTTSISQIAQSGNCVLDLSGNRITDNTCRALLGIQGIIEVNFSRTQIRSGFKTVLFGMGFVDQVCERRFSHAYHPVCGAVTTTAEQDRIQDGSEAFHQ